MRMVAGHPWQPVKAIVVLRRGGVPVVGFQQTDYVFVIIRPPACGRAILRDIVGERPRVGLECRHEQVARKNIVQGRDIGRPLDGCVAAERQNAAARPANVA